MNIRNGLQMNIPGQMVNGTQLRNAAPLQGKSRQNSSEYATVPGCGESPEKPDEQELNLMYHSFKPGMSAS